MKSFDFDAVVFNGEVYCKECLPDTADIDSDDVAPIFADSEWDCYPLCSVCNEKHTYMGLTTDGELYEQSLLDGQAEDEAYETMKDDELMEGKN